MSRILSIVLLTLSFCNPSHSDVVLLGDSTVADVREPLYGWGELLPEFLPNSSVKNRASSGASSRSYYQGYWTTTGWPYDQPVKDMVQPGDYVLIQFGHNDIPSGPPIAAVADLEEYKSWLTVLVNEANELGALPIFITPPEGWAHRRQGIVGHIVQRQGHADAMKEVAELSKVPYIDLHAYSVEQFGLRTEEEAIAQFEALNPETGLPSGDKTHTSFTGAEFWAKFIASEFPATAAEHFADAPGDFDLDGETTLADFLTLSRNFKQTFPIPDSFRQGDSNVDGIVDLRDFLAFRTAFRNQGVESAAVPEPNSLALLYVGALTILLLRRRRN